MQQANGANERLTQTIVNALRIVMESQDEEWTAYLGKIVRDYRNMKVTLLVCGGCLYGAQV